MVNNHIFPFHLKGKEAERKRQAKTDLLSSCSHPKCQSQAGVARLKPGAQGSAQVSHIHEGKGGQGPKDLSHPCRLPQCAKAGSWIKRKERGLQPAILILNTCTLRGISPTVPTPILQRSVSEWDSSLSSLNTELKEREKLPSPWPMGALSTERLISSWDVTRSSPKGASWPRSNQQQSQGSCWMLLRVQTHFLAWGQTQSYPVCKPGASSGPPLHLSDNPVYVACPADLIPGLQLCIHSVSVYPPGPYTFETVITVGQNCFVEFRTLQV